MKRVLIVAQAIPQWYVDTLTEALGENTEIEIITGSKIKGNVITSPPHNPTSLKSRLVCWWKHFCFMKKWMRENSDKHFDMIFAVSNPPINSYIGIKLKKKFHSPFFYMNWDLYPQCIEYMIHNPAVNLVCKAWHHWNSKNYEKIDCMLTIGEVVAESINEKLKKKIPVRVIPIATDTERLKPIAKSENPFCKEYDLVDKFVVLYSGKMGYGHNIEVILKASEILQSQDHIQFVFIGDGPKYKIVEDFIRENNASNILLLPLQPEEIFTQSMACGDIGIVSQETAMAHLFMPSKTYSMMACGMAIVGICSSHDDLQKLILASDCGETVNISDENKLAETLLLLYKNEELLKKYKSNARREVEMQYSKSVIVERYRELFQQYLIQE